MNTRIIFAGLVTAVFLRAAGNPPPPNTAEVKVSNETIPAGGTVQAKFSFTEPRPITSTGAGYYLGSMKVAGLSLFSATGDAGGIGVLKDGYLVVSALSPSGGIGNTLDYPFLTIAADIPSSAKTGSTSTLTLSSDSSISTAAGPMTMSLKPGTLTIGGSVSIRGVYPGGGTWPAGTVVKVLGTGFKSNTRLQAKIGITSVLYVSSAEIDFTLKDQTAMDSQQIQVINPDGSSDIYFAYLRGTLVRPPSRTLLQNSEPAFPLQTHALASLIVPSLNSSQFVGLALQNPNPGPLVVTFELDTASGASITSVTLPSGYRLVDDLSSLLAGATVNPGDTFKLTSTAPLQILGLNGDESVTTVTPFFPAF